MAKPHLCNVAPATENRTVIARRRKNVDLRTREHLTADEIERLIEVAKDNRHGHRDGLMVLLTFRHGLRAVEVCDLRWEQVDFKSNPARPPGQERHAGHTSIDRSGNARAAQTSKGKRAIGIRVRVGTRRAASGAWFLRMVERAATPAALGIKAHAHILRHACATSSPMMASIPARCRLTSATATSRTRHDTWRSHRIGSKISGKIR